MTDTAVVYQSRYGSTARYAHWIADRTDADLMRLAETKPTKLLQYDQILFGTPILAGTLGCSRFIRLHADLLAQVRVGLFVVGITPCDGQVRAEVCAAALSEDMLDWIDIFHLRGAIDYRRLSLMHKAMMKLVDRTTMQRARRDPTPENLEAAAQVGKNMNFVARAATDPIVDWAMAAR